MRTYLFIGIFLGLLPVLAHAQNDSEDQCMNALKEDLADIHFEYRSVLFGSRKVYDEDGNEKFEVLTGGYTDEERVGIFETKRRLTTELVPALIESMRVYRCRMLTSCALLNDSFVNDGGESTIRLLGCSEQTLTRYPQCFFGSNDTPGLSFSFTSLVNQCKVITERTFAAEQAVLKLAVGYDAGYRALLQTAGIMDWMLEGFPTAALKAVSEMVNMLGKLYQIPCFIGQCDNPRSDYLTPAPTP